MPGKSLITADTLSRAPIQHTFTAEEKEKEAEVKVFLDAVTQSLPATEQRLREIAAKQKSDLICAQLIRYCESQWPERHALPLELAPFWSEKNSLTLNGQLLLRGQRIVIPGELRGEILQQLHSGHQGIVKCRARARQSVWWPGLSVHIKQMVENCNICSQHRAEQREPLLTTAVQERPWQRVETDLFCWENSTYLLIVDYFSRYIEVAHLRVATAETVVAALKDVFARHGTPETVMSDNGPQYSGSVFHSFAKAYGFAHVTSSPRYPQANGEAERAVATVKGLWKGKGDKAAALQTYRATPLESGYSPAQLLMGRQIRTGVPQIPAAFAPGGQTSGGSGSRKGVQKRTSSGGTTNATEFGSCRSCSQAKKCGCPKKTSLGQLYRKRQHPDPTSSTLMKAQLGVIAHTCAQFTTHRHLHWT